MSIYESLTRQIVSKIIVDRTRISRSTYQRVEPLIDEIKDWADVFSGVLWEEPGTWLQAGMELFDRMIENEVVEVDPITMFLSENSFSKKASPAIDWVGEALLNSCDLLPEVESGERKLCKVVLNHGVYAYAMVAGEATSFEALYFPEDDDLRDKVYAEVSAVVWETLGPAARLCTEADEVIATPHKITSREYIGDTLGEIESFKKFMDAGVRRVVIFQGEPGTGKSTLAENAARILSDRTLIVDNNILSGMSRADWAWIIQTVSPTLVIVDDIDRIHHASLTQLLFLFEDSHYNVPVTILTTNDQEALPDAFRRPGRIDQIIDMPLPTDEIRKEVLKTLARMEGVEDMPEYIIRFLDSLLKDYPAAHTVEMLRRFKVLGWDYNVPDNDIVFTPILEDLLDEYTPSSAH